MLDMHLGRYRETGGEEALVLGGPLWPVHPLQRELEEEWLMRCLGLREFLRAVVRCWLVLIHASALRHDGQISEPALRLI